MGKFMIVSQDKFPFMCLPKYIHSGFCDYYLNFASTNLFLRSKTAYLFQSSMLL